MRNSIAIIGAAGFVGTSLLEYLVLEKACIPGAIVRSFKSMGKICRFGDCVRYHLGDAENSDSLKPALKGYDVVVNLTTAIDATGIIRSTKAIMEACRQAGVKRLIHLSSAVVFDEAGSPEIHDDSDLLKSYWMPYAAAKAESERIIRSTGGIFPFEIVVLRPGIVWGPRSSWSMNAALGLKNRNIYLVGDGKGVCNSIYIGNLLEAIYRCCQFEQDASGFYNISDNEFITWFNFYAGLADIFNYDMAKTPKIPDDKFNVSVKTRLNEFRETEIYQKLKNQVPLECRDTIKYWISAFQARFSKNDTLPSASEFEVTREMWHLQRTKNKLPNHKFLNHFNFTAPYSFVEGMALTKKWLKFMIL